MTVEYTLCVGGAFTHAEATARELVDGGQIIPESADALAQM
jgi:hypothetical protein